MKKLLVVIAGAIGIVFWASCVDESTDTDPIGSIQEPVGCADNATCAPNGIACNEGAGTFICVGGQFDPAPQICLSGEACYPFQWTCVDPCGQTLMCDDAGFLIPNPADPFCVPDAGIGGTGGTTASSTASTTAGTTSTTSSSTSTTTTVFDGGVGGAGGTGTVLVGGAGGIGGATTTSSTTTATSTATSTGTTTSTASTTTTTVDPTICTAGNACYPEQGFCTDVLNFPQFIRCCGGVLVKSSASTPCPVIDAGTDSGNDASVTDASADASVTDASLTDASADASSDASISDASSDAQIDASIDSGTDASADASISDASSDASISDAASDAQSDASIDSGSDASACAPGGAIGNGNVEFIWTPPTGYTQNGQVVAIGGYPIAGGYTNFWSNATPLCTLVPDGACGFHCFANLPTAVTVDFNIFHADPYCPTYGGGWMFDEYTYACGACIGLADCCGKTFGTVTIKVNGAIKTHTMTTNPDALPCTKNGQFQT